MTSTPFCADLLHAELCLYLHMYQNRSSFKKPVIDTETAQYLKPYYALVRQLPKLIDDPAYGADRLLILSRPSLQMRLSQMIYDYGAYMDGMQAIANQSLCGEKNSANPDKTQTAIDAMQRHLMTGRLWQEYCQLLRNPALLELCEMPDFIGGYKHGTLIQQIPGASSWDRDIHPMLAVEKAKPHAAEAAIEERQALFLYAFALQVNYLQKADAVTFDDFLKHSKHYLAKAVNRLLPKYEAGITHFTKLVNRFLTKNDMSVFPAEQRSVISGAAGKPLSDKGFFMGLSMN